MPEHLHTSREGALTISAHDGDPTVLVVRGDLDAIGLVLLRQLVDPLLLLGVHVVADLEGVGYASPQAAAYLVGDRLRPVAVVAPSRAVERAVVLARICGQVDEPDGATTLTPSPT